MGAKCLLTEWFGVGFSAFLYVIHGLPVSLEGEMQGALDH